MDLGHRQWKWTESRQLVPSRSGEEAVMRHCIQISHLWKWACERVGVGVVGEVTSLQQSIHAAFNSLSNEIIPDQFDGLWWLKVHSKGKKSTVLSVVQLGSCGYQKMRIDYYYILAFRGGYTILKAIRCLFNAVSWYLNSIYRFQILQVVLWGIWVGFSR